MSTVARPCREELEALVRDYHHVESEHERAHPEGAVRHHLALRLREDRERFEHALAAYVPDELMQQEWRDYLHHRGGEPSSPTAIRLLVFKGRSSANSMVEIRRDRSGELAVDVDGRLVERLPAEQAPLAVERAAVFELDDVEFRETFDVPPAAAQALREFCASGGKPPWEHASELLSDGLIDLTFGLTARGRRALATRRRAAS